ncbi:transcriptional regulator [Frankia torreyi]|uniref:Transcriptional regulator n=3 Tax=Frankia TaxID=1854 RepID=A0A0D8BBQ3_9ACTN|nr:MULTISPECIES: LysR family transcriptional regulator [Frankia]KJE20802.1 transcriptional regulator [Frankia torreyi]
MLNLERLRVLCLVARYGSVGAAADMLHVTTSSVSQQIAKLERETGTDLLLRHGRGVRLTAAATLLVDHAERILSMMSEAEAHLHAQLGKVVGTLTVGAFPTAARGLLPAALRLLGEGHPSLVVRVEEMDFQSPLVRVGRGELDLGLVQDWENAPMTLPDGLHRATLMADVAEVALPADHPLAGPGRDWIAVDEVLGERWISRTVGSTCHDWLIHTLRAHDAQPRIEHTVIEYSTQLAMVAAGMGLAMVPRLGQGPVPAGVRVLPLRPVLGRSIYAVWRADNAGRPAVRHAVAALRAAAQSA